MNGTSTRRASAERPGGWWKPGRRRRRMDPGASGPNGKVIGDRRDLAHEAPAQSASDRGQRRSPGIVREADAGKTRAAGNASAASPNEGGTAEGTTFRPGDDRSFLILEAQR